MGGKPLPLEAAAAQENVRKLVDRVLQGLRAPEPPEVPPEQLTAAFDHIDQVAGRSDLREDVAMALMNKGNALRNLKRLEEALACYDRAIENDEERVRAGRSDLREDVATALENKYLLIKQQGDLTQAPDLIGRAVAIRLQLHKPKEG